MSDFLIGTQTSKGWCCGKPAGCSIETPGCPHMRQKTNAPGVRCQAVGWPDAATPGGRNKPVNQLMTWQCTLPAGHDMPYQQVHHSEPIGVGARPILNLRHSDTESPS